MKRIVKILVLLILCLSLLACNLGSMLSKSKAINATAVVLASNTPQALQPSPTLEPTVPAEVAQTGDGLDPCSVVTLAEAETILAEPASAPTPMNGACTFSNAKDALYTVTVAAAQDKDTNGILQGQAMLLAFAGAQIDETRMNNLKLMAAALDYTGFFTELIAAAEGIPTLKAQLIEKDGMDIAYWLWITIDTRRQGAFVAVRENTMVNINLVVADTQTEEAMLATSSALAEQVFERLPEKFALAVPTAYPTQVVDVGATETAVALALLPPPTPTLVTLSAPVLVSPGNNTTFDIYPRTTVLKWEPVEGAVKYVIEIHACMPADESNCFPFPKDQNGIAETTATSYTFNFVGAQPGKWRVYAVDANGQPGAVTSWSHFNYLQ